MDELKYFQKKYSFDVKILSNDKFVIPEYKIDLMNKSKKVINSIENINSIVDTKKLKKKLNKPEKDKNKVQIKNKDKLKKPKTKKKTKNFWVRRKKRAKLTFNWGAWFCKIIFFHSAS